MTCLTWPKTGSWLCSFWVRFVLVFSEHPKDMGWTVLCLHKMADVPLLRLRAVCSLQTAPEHLPKRALLIWMMPEKNTGQRLSAREIQGLPLPLQPFLEWFCALIQSILFKILVPWSLSILLEIYESVLEGGGICKRFLVCRVFLPAVWGWDMMLLKARKQHKTKETVFRVEIAVLRLNGWSHLTVHLFFILF